MAGVINSGTYDAQANALGEMMSSVPSKGYCQEAATSTTSYPSASSDQNFHTFGFKARTVIIHNEGAADICFTFKSLYGVLNGGNQVDSGVVKAGQTLTLVDVHQDGMKFRNRAAGTNNYVISAY